MPERAAHQFFIFLFSSDNQPCRLDIFPGWVAPSVPSEDPVELRPEDDTLLIDAAGTEEEDMLDDVAFARPALETLASDAAMDDNTADSDAIAQSLSLRAVTSLMLARALVRPAKRELPLLPELPLM